VLGFCSGPGAGGAILVIRRDQTADAVWPAGWRRAACRGGKGGGGGGGGGMARMRLPYLCKLPESFAPRARESVSVTERRRRGGESGNDEISGVTARRCGGGEGGSAARGGTFQTLLIRRAGGGAGGRAARRSEGRRAGRCCVRRARVCTRENDGERGEKKKE